MLGRATVWIVCGLALGCGGNDQAARERTNGTAGQGTAGVMAAAGVNATAGTTGLPQAGMVATPQAGASGAAGTSTAGAAGAMVPQAGVGEAGMQAGAGDMAASTGSAGAAGAAGSAGTDAIDRPTIDSCAPPPADASDNAVTAWMLLNEIRLAAGAGCINLVSELNTSAQLHCDYIATNMGSGTCDAGAHGQVMGCPGFTGADVQSREVAAGYPRELAYTQVVHAYGDNPMLAVPGWIDTVWHRIPVLDPWVGDMGWGGGPGCDDVDLGRGMSTTPRDAIVVYPYDGQTDVPPSFSGLEGPAPPPPPGGWPSAYPINVYAQGIQVTEHVVMKDGDDTPLEHLWLDLDAPEVGSLRSYFRNTVFMYGAPFELSTKYRVRIVGTYDGGAFTKEWTFTTGARRPWGA